MVSLFPSRRRKHQPARSRRRAETINRVGLAQLAPAPERFIAHAAYLQLALFETVSRAMVQSPSMATKAALSRVANTVLDRHHALTDELQRLGLDPAESMEPFAAAIDEFNSRTAGSDWAEVLMTAYVVSGILDDCLVQLAGGLPGDYPQRVEDLLGNDDVTDPLADVIAAQIDAQPRLASRLALWGRRLVGDTLLIARSAADIPQDTATDDERLEPVFTDLVAEHTRRMDELGLTA